MAMSVKQFSAPVSYGSSVTSTISRKEAQPCRYARSEFIASILGTTNTFSLALNLSLNPGLSSFLPWLSGIANSFDMYSFKRLRFMYLAKTSSSNTGEVDMAYDPDPTDPAPTSQALILNYGVRCSSSVWSNCSVEVPSVDLRRLPRFLTRSAVVPGELGTFDIGQLFVATSGNASNAVVGQLWVEYEVEFYTPQPVAMALSTGPRSTSQFTNSVAQPMTSGAPLTLNFDTATYNPLGSSVPSSGSISGLQGSFSFYLQLTVQASSITNGFLSIMKNSAAVCNVALPLLSAAGYSSASLFVAMSLVPSDIVQAQVVATGTGLSAMGTINRFLLLAPA